MKRNSQNKVVIYAVVGSLLIHGVIAVVMLTPAVVRLFAPRERVVVKEEVEEKLIFRFQAAPKVAVVKAEEVKEREPEVKTVEEKRKRFVRTSEDQARGVVEDAERIGERDTVARSDAEAREDAPDQAAVKGEKREDEETTNSNQQLGDLAHEAVAREQQQAVEAESAIPPPPEEKVEPEEKEEVAKSEERKELLEMREKVAVAKRAEEREKERAEAMKKQAEEEHRKKEEAEEMARKEIERKEREAEAERERLAALEKSKAGFKPTVKAAETMGSISRRGKASQNVKATPTGRYMGEVIKRVGEEWYRRCGERADLLVPGSLTMGWFVYEDGSVKHLEIKSELNGGMIQRGITIQSIKSARVPAMPKEVRDELRGDPLYIQINFEF